MKETLRTPFIPYGRPSLDDSDAEAVARVLSGTWLSGGPAVTAFERELAVRVGAGDVVVTSSGTAALHLACLAAGLGDGDAVLVPAITFVATANAVRHTGAEVVFVDVDSATGLVTREYYREAMDRARVLGLHVRAIIPVHYAGQVADVMAAARGDGLTVIEDACHAIGSEYIDETNAHRKVGDCASAESVCFSFHPLKNITTGEGGAIACSNAVTAARLRALRDHGLARQPAAFVNHEAAFGDDGRVNPWYYEMSELGLNYRLTDIQCALGLSQLKRLGSFADVRRRLVALYDAGFRHAANITPLVKQDRQSPAWHLYVVLINFAKTARSRGELMRYLESRGIGTQVHYLPVYRHPYYARRYGYQPLAGAESFYETALSLPLFSSMTEDEVATVVAELASALSS